MKKEPKKLPESADSKHQLEVKTKTKDKSRDKLSSSSSRTTDKTTTAKPKPKREKSKTALTSDEVRPVEVEVEPPEECAKYSEPTVKASLTNGASGDAKPLLGVGHTFRPQLKRDLSRECKPPNVLVYADSAVAKANVKEVLHRILNREK